MYSCFNHGVCWRVCSNKIRKRQICVLAQATCNMLASTQAKNSSSSLHFLPSVRLWSRAEALCCPLADPWPAESREGAGKLKRKQKSRAERATVTAG